MKPDQMEELNTIRRQAHKGRNEALRIWNHRLVDNFQIIIDTVERLVLDEQGRESKT